jgi:hypothetical protein
MRKIVEGVLHVSLSGVSLTVISFTFVFLFHGVGGGLFSGTVIFRMLQLYSKRENLEILTTLLVILTIIQPFICIHPVIIWSQDSNHNAKYLLLTIFIWFLPLTIHLLVKAIVNQINERYKNRSRQPEKGNINSEITPLNNNRNGKKRKNISSQTSLLSNRKTELSTPENTSPASFGKRKSKQSQISLPSNQKIDESPIASVKTPPLSAQARKVLMFVDIGMQITQLSIFLLSFSFITHHIINTELDSERHDLKNFVLPAIISVFMWMLSISYFLLTLVMNSTEDATPLVYKDMFKARTELQESLRKRLAHMDKRSTIGGRTSMQHGPLRPTRPPPPPPLNQQGNSKQLALPDTSSSAGNNRVAKTLPPIPPRNINQVKPDVPPKPQNKSIGNIKTSPSASFRIRIKEMETNLGDLKTRHEKVAVESKKTLNEIDVAGDNSEDEIKVDVIESLEIEDVDYEDKKSCCSRFLDYVLERSEYRFPEIHGWRIKFRRIFLHLGVIGFSYTTFDTFMSTQNYSSKAEIQKLLDYAGTNLTWPDEGSVLDDVFLLYNKTQQRKSYVMIAASVLFWSSFFLDIKSYWTERKSTKDLCVVGSRVVNFLGSLLVFASVILVGLPDYLAASNLDTICPFCGEDFNKTVKQVAEFSIGLVFACIFTFQLLPVLLTIPPALVRASVLILIHPGLRKTDKTTVLRMSILQQVVLVSSMLSFPITFVSMCIIDQHQKSVTMSILIILYWVLPPIILYMGLHYSRKYKRYTILLYVYYLYNTTYFGLLMALLLYSLQLEQVIEILRSLLESPTVWFGTMAQIFLCNVVISDLLYMTVF